VALSGHPMVEGVLWVFDVSNIGPLVRVLAVWQMGMC
jgi:hypothetical protein